MDIDAAPAFIRDVEQRQRLLLAGGPHEVDFPREGGMIFHGEALPRHENAMRILAFAGDECLYSQTYYSVGGGFIVDEAHFGQPVIDVISVPHPFNSAQQLLDQCKATGLSLSGLVMRNELALHVREDIDPLFRRRLANHARLHRSRPEYRRGAARSRCGYRVGRRHCGACWCHRISIPTIPW